MWGREDSILASLPQSYQSKSALWPPAPAHPWGLGASSWPRPSGSDAHFTSWPGSSMHIWAALFLNSVGFPGGTVVKKSTYQCRRHAFNPWVGKIPWRRAWQPTPVFSPGEFHGWRSLADYHLWGHKGSDTTEQLITALFSSINIIQLWPRRDLERWLYNFWILFSFRSTGVWLTGLLL